MLRDLVRIVQAILLALGLEKKFKRKRTQTFLTVSPNPDRRSFRFCIRVI